MRPLSLYESCPTLSPTLVQSVLTGVSTWSTTILIACPMRGKRSELKYFARLSTTTPATVFPHRRLPLRLSRGDSRATCLQVPTTDHRGHLIIPTTLPVSTTLLDPATFLGLPSQLDPPPRAHPPILNINHSVHLPEPSIPTQTSPADTSPSLSRKLIPSSTLSNLNFNTHINLTTSPFSRDLPLRLKVTRTPKLTSNQMSNHLDRAEGTVDHLQPSVDVRTYPEAASKHGATAQSPDASMWGPARRWKSTRGIDI